jgi:hypothetical protein
VPSEARSIINFDHPSDDWPLRTLLRFYVRTPNALTVGPTSYIYLHYIISTYCIISLTEQRQGERERKHEPRGGAAQEEGAHLPQPVGGSRTQRAGVRRRLTAAARAARARQVLRRLHRHGCQPLELRCQYTIALSIPVESHDVNYTPQFVEFFFSFIYH